MKQTIFEATQQKQKINTAKNKPRKSKRVKQQIQVGAKIRDLKIDLSTNLFILALLLIVFNCVFICSALLLAYWINIWWVWLIDIIIALYCAFYSLATFVYYNSNNYYYSLHENCLVLNSIRYDNTIIEYKMIKQIKTKIGFWDKIIGRGTCTMTMYLNDDAQTKIKIYFIKENATQLYNEIWTIVNKQNCENN